MLFLACTTVPQYIYIYIYQNHTEPSWPAQPANYERVTKGYFHLLTSNLVLRRPGFKVWWNMDCPDSRPQSWMQWLGVLHSLQSISNTLVASKTWAHLSHCNSCHVIAPAWQSTAFFEWLIKVAMLRAGINGIKMRCDNHHLCWFTTLRAAFIRVQPCWIWSACTSLFHAKVPCLTRGWQKLHISCFYPRIYNTQVVLWNLR